LEQLLKKNKLGGTVNDRSCRSFIQLSKKQQQNESKKENELEFLDGFTIVHLHHVMIGRQKVFCRTL